MPQTLNLFLSFEFFIQYSIPATLLNALKHDFWYALSHVQSHLELSELDERAHRQADVTNHQLHDQVYCDYDNTDHTKMDMEKLNRCIKCTNNIEKICSMRRMECRIMFCVFMVTLELYFYSSELVRNILKIPNIVTPVLTNVKVSHRIYVIVY
jgi:hypothetical protein